MYTLRGRHKLCLFIDDVTVYVEQLEELTKERHSPGQIRGCSKAAGIG